MEIRRIVLFVVLSALILIGWQFTVMKFFPPVGKPPAAQQAAKNPPQPEPAQDEEPVEAPDVDEVAGAEAPPAAQSDLAAFLKAAAQPAGPSEYTLGSIADDAPYLMQVALTTQGAAVQRIELGGKKFRQLENDDPLALVEPVPTDAEGVDAYRTFQTSFAKVNEAIREVDPKLDLNHVHWEVVEQGPVKGGEALTFRFQLPGGQVEILKRYMLSRVPEGQSIDVARKTYTDGYFVHLTLTVRNVSSEPQVVGYSLLGPVGLPLEDRDNTRKFRDIKLEYIRDGSTAAGTTVTAKEVAEADETNALKDYFVIAPVLYAGVDLQYFAALVFPTDQPAALASQPQPQDFIEQIEPVLIERDRKTVTHSQITLKFVSKDVTLEPAGQFDHNYTLYAGPKREALLDPISADDVIEFGWFSWLGRGMVWLLNFFHNTLWLPYGIAIICLTIVVRGILFPLSRKQAINAQKMKELQPKIAELKKKYANDKEKFARAQMEMFRKHNYNIFGGCLPILMQFPIFIALYNALYAAVDLRRAEFLWIDNLGSPDKLFPLGFTVPFVGWTHFNLLPLLTVVLFIAQQKMFLPDPNPNDEQAMMQQRIMKFMTFFLGFLFYRVPAGLCIYFIASSLWGIGERKFLNLSTGATDPVGDSKTIETTAKPVSGVSGRRDGGREISKGSAKKSKPRW